MKLVIYLLSCLAILSTLQCHHMTSATNKETNHGLKLRLSQTGLNYAGQIAVDLLADKVNGFALPDQKGSWSGYVSTVNYAITNSKVSGFKKPNTFIATNARAREVTWMALGADIAVSGQWSYDYTVWWTYSDKGSFIATATDVRISIGVRLGRSPTGQPTIVATSCQSLLAGGVRFNLGGWLYNLFANVFVGFVTQRLEAKICDAAKSAINVNAAWTLAGVRLQIDEFPGCPFDYSLTLDPTIETNYVEFSHRGDCVGNTAVNRTDPVSTPPPSPPAALTFPPTAPKMVSILLSDSTLNSVVYHTYQPGSYSFKFGLSGVIDKFPELAAVFQNNTPHVHLVVVQPPTVAFRPSLAIANIFCIARLSSSIAANGTELDLLDVEINATLAVTLRFNGTTLTGNTSLESLTAKVRLLNGRLDVPLPDSVLNEAARHLVSTYVIPPINIAGGNGFPIPHLDFLKFPEAQLELQEGAVLLATNVRYTG